MVDSSLMLLSLAISIGIVIPLIPIIFDLDTYKKKFEPRVRVKKYADGTYRVEYSYLDQYERIRWNYVSTRQTSNLKQVQKEIKEAREILKRNVEWDSQEYKHNHVIKTTEIK